MNINQIKEFKELELKFLQIAATQYATQEELEILIKESLKYPLDDLEKQIQCFDRFVSYKQWQEYYLSNETEESRRADEDRWDRMF